MKPITHLHPAPKPKIHGAVHLTYITFTIWWSSFSSLSKVDHITNPWINMRDLKYWIFFWREDGVQYWTQRWLLWATDHSICFNNNNSVLAEPVNLKYLHYQSHYYSCLRTLYATVSFVKELTKMPLISCLKNHNKIWSTNTSYGFFFHSWSNSP